MNEELREIQEGALLQKKDVLCHASGDRCHGCAHYRGETPVCDFAPSQCGQTLAAKSQAAAMAGLLEEARQKLDQWQGFFACDSDVPEPPITLPTIIRIDAQLAAWKESQRAGEGK